MTSHRLAVNPGDLFLPIEVTTSRSRASNEPQPHVLVGEIDKGLAELRNHLGFRLTGDVDDTSAIVCDNDTRSTDVQAYHRQSVRQAFEHDHATGIVKARK